MSATLTLHDLAVGHGPRTLFTGLDLVVAAGDVTALVGVNGSGKTSLLRAIAGELPPESGSISVAPPEAPIGYLPQTPPDPAETLLAHVRRRTGVTAADAAFQRASATLAEQSPGAEAAYDRALQRWLALGAADLDERVPALAAQVGLRVPLDRPLGTLSGGQAARATLVAILASRYEVLLLDEPTNDLDGTGRAQVTEFIAGHPGPVLLASHDRALLDEVATSVVDLDLRQRRIGHHAGNWTAYVEARALERRHAEEEFAAYADERDSLLARARQREEWARTGRRNAGDGRETDKHIREKHRARADRQGAKSARLLAAADRLTEVEQPRKEWELRYSVSAGPASADVVATLSRVVVRRGAFTLGPLDWTLERGSRWAVSGDNGSGKSTLLGALLGEIPLVSGTATLGARVRVGVLDQRRQRLDSGERLVDLVAGELGWRDAGEVRTLLAKFGLGADHVERPARSLSLGERTRARLAIFQGRAVNLLVLDEPTNHLDLAGLEALEAALAAYDGTLVVVSHDRRFLDAVGVTDEFVLGGSD